jgi:nitric oxide reductase NorQ protein
MSGALESLMETVAKDATVGEDADGLFGVLATVKPDPARASAASKSKPAKKGAPSASASIVRNALALIDDEAAAVSDDEISTARVQAKPGTSFRAIKRLNGELYRPRVLADGRSDVEVLRACRERDLRVLLYGYPGTGKTALVEAAFGAELVVVNGHADTEVADLVGGYVAQPDGSYRWVDGPLVIAMREGRPLFVDDATLIAPGVIARLYPAMDGRRVIVLREHEGEQIAAADGFFVLAAHNPNAPGAILSEALASRFALHIRVESDLKMAQTMGVSRRAVQIAAALQTMRAKGDGFGWAPEMRELLDYARVEEAFGEATALANLISVAPDEAKDEVVKLVRTYFPDADTLALRGEVVE